jgi:hypothetical protein
VDDDVVGIVAVDLVGHGVGEVVLDELSVNDGVVDVVEVDLVGHGVELTSGSDAIEII